MSECQIADMRISTNKLSEDAVIVHQQHCSLSSIYVKILNMEAGMERDNTSEGVVQFRICIDVFAAPTLGGHIS